jgi:hypothetical protein
MNLEELPTRNANIGGSPPNALGELSSLVVVHLDLFDNELTCTTPTALGRLSNLTSLSVGSKTLDVTNMPSELVFLTGLVFLHHGYNSLNGTMPSEIGDLSRASRSNCNTRRWL